SERELRVRAQSEAAHRHENEPRVEDARGATEDAGRRLQIITELSDELASSLDPQAMHDKLAERLVETMADYAITYIYEGQRIRRLGLAHRLEYKRALLHRLDEAGRPAIHDAIGVGAVIRTGQPVLVGAI